MKHLNDEQLILHHYQESDEGPSMEAHLACCEACRARYQALSDALAAIPLMPVPERPADYGRRVWQRLRPRLDEPSPSFWRRLLVWPGLPGFPRWRPAPAMMLAVLVAFLGGAFWSHFVSRNVLAGRLRQELRAEVAVDFQSALKRSEERSANAIAGLEARLARASRAEARELARALTDLQGRARVEDREALLALLREWGDQNASAYVGLRQELEALASSTDRDLRRARYTLVELAAHTPWQEQPFERDKDNNQH
jgi:hypothetical protein